MFSKLIGGNRSVENMEAGQYAKSTIFRRYSMVSTTKQI